MSLRALHTLWEARVGTGTLETGWSYRWWCFEPNPGPLQERPVHVKAEPSLQLRLCGSISLSYCDVSLCCVRWEVALMLAHGLISPC